MTNPAPDKLSRLLHAQQRRWRQPERRLVDSGEIAVLRALWITSRDEVLALQNNYDDARTAVAALEERIPVVRDILFWTHDPDARLPFSLFADTIGVTTEEASKELFCGVSRDLLAVVSNIEPVRCPLCERRR
jgi:hypothetical protein